MNKLERVLKVLNLKVDGKYSIELDDERFIGKVYRLRDDGMFENVVRDGIKWELIRGIMVGDISVKEVE